MPAVTVEIQLQIRVVHLFTGSADYGIVQNIHKKRAHLRIRHGQLFGCLTADNLCGDSLIRGKGNLPVHYNVQHFIVAANYRMYLLQLSDQFLQILVSLPGVLFCKCLEQAIMPDSIMPQHHHFLCLTAQVLIALHCHLILFDQNNLLRPEPNPLFNQFDAIGKYTRSHT